MLLSEEDVKAKWCPHAVASHTDPRRGFREREKGSSWIEPEFPCIASACMAWRWWDGPRLTNLSRDDMDDNHKLEQGRQEYGHGQRRGYCGLAGRPE